MASPKLSQAHSSLGPDFFDAVTPAAFPETILRYRNQRWAERIGLGDLDITEWIAHFGRFEPLEGSFEAPLALRYHGHQFRAYNPDLGDGRGFLFAQLHDLEDGRLLDLGTKGSGTTPWSRGGDGRLTLKGGIREVLASEMLEALGVSTSKSFSLIETGEALHREDEPSPTRASVLVRLSHSHIRIGTFQRLFALKDHANLARLADHCIAHYYPEIADRPAETRVPAFLGAVAERVAETAARWTAVGFVHGVLNTDNINITGESFDYGPWRFLPSYQPGFTAASFDQGGLFAFGRQPDALAWTLTRFAECLVPLAEIAALEPELNRFWPRFQAALAEAVLDRLGLESVDEKKDAELMSALLSFLQVSQAPFEQVMFDLRGGLAQPERLEASPVADHYAGKRLSRVKALLEGFSPRAGALDHSYFERVAPRTMLLEDVEALWAPIDGADDWMPFNAALDEIGEMRQAYAGTAG